MCITSNFGTQIPNLSPTNQSMKKLLLAFSAATLTAAAVNAQSRMALYEEFTGENCGPCATYNPNFEALLLSSGNAGKIILIKYQSPIPSAGPIYNQYKTVTNNRISYYGINSAPSGRLDGKVQGSGHIADMDQAAINSEVSGAAKFTITVSHSWNATLDSLTANVTVKATTAFSPSGANMKLRVALIEHLEFTSPPGTNGETDFQNVVREMYPDANGTAIPNSWTANQTQNYTLKGKVPAYVDKGSTETRVVVWVQDDNDKTIYQAAQSAPAKPQVDIATSHGSAPLMACAASSASVVSSVTLKNTGATTLTSAKLFARADNSSTYVTSNWTGSLAPGATTSITMPAVTLSVGARNIIDSVGMPNGNTDLNLPNNTFMIPVRVINTPTPVTLPYTQNFEASGFPAGFYSFDPNYSGNLWVNGNGSGAAHNGSSYMPWYKVGTYAPGSVGYLVIPVPGGSGVRALEFWQAYAQKTASSSDKLEVVYSTDCGANWSGPLWARNSAGLATTTPQSAYWLPSPASNSPDWAQRSVDLSGVPANALLAFRATAGGGNNLFIDDINMRTGPVGVEAAIVKNSASVYPNPAREAATLEFSLAQNSKVTISLIDPLGRTVDVLADGMMSQGTQQISIPTNNLAAGVYNVSIQTEQGNLTQRLSVVK